MNTLTTFQTKETTINAYKPNLYYSDRNKLEAQLLQVDRYFDLARDKIKYNNKVILATSYY